MTLDVRHTTVEEIQLGLKRRLETIEFLRASAHEVERPDFPAAYSRLVSWTYDSDFDKSTEWLFDVWVIVGISGTLSRAHGELNAYLAPYGRKSVKVALDGDPTLGGCVNFTRATGGGEYGRVDVAGTAALGASIRVEVSAP